MCVCRDASHCFPAWNSETSGRQSGRDASDEVQATSGRRCSVRSAAAVPMTLLVYQQKQKQKQEQEHRSRLSGLSSCVTTPAHDSRPPPSP